MSRTPDEVGGPGGAVLDSIVIEVSHVRRSIEFVRALGVGLAPVGSDQLFASRRMPDFRVDWVVSTPTPLDIRLGVRCREPADVDRLVHLSQAAGHLVRRGPVDESWGCRTALLVDPDGHLVELYAPYP